MNEDMEVMRWACFCRGSFMYFSYLTTVGRLMKNAAQVSFIIFFFLLS